MKYREQILEFIFGTDDDAYFNWLHSLPPHDVVDALNEYRAIVTELNPDPNHPGLREKLAEIETLTDAYQDANLRAETLSLKAEVAQREAEKAAMEFAEALETTKRNIREGLANNHPDSAAMIEYAKFLIESEKQVGLYDPDDWAWFEGRY